MSGTGNRAIRRTNCIQEPAWQPTRLAFEVHGLIAQSFSKEFIEAVVEHAMRILLAHKHREDTLVAINPRRVAVILDKKAHKGP